jgi:hypothetical protein
LLDVSKGMKILMEENNQEEVFTANWRLHIAESIGDWG